MNDKASRFMELEGLRVIAAVVVVLFHAAMIFYPAFFYGLGTQLAGAQNARFEHYLYQNPLSGVLSGTFAVGIFFVLSGFVLSIGFFQTRDLSIVKRLAAKRYLRLMVPALASVLIAWLFLKVGWSRSMPNVVTETHSGWLSNLWLVPPHFLQALNQGIEGIFKGEVYYNPVLWTIQYEFLGSFIVFGSLLMFSSSRYRWVLYGILLFVLANSWLLGFMSGMILADLYANRRAVFKKLDNKLTYLVVLLGIVFGGYPAGEITSPIYKALWVPGLNSPSEMISFFVSFGATLLVVGVLSISRIRNFLAHPMVSGFGKYTYSLYLIHMPILFTVCTGVFAAVFPIIGFHKGSIVAVMATIAVLVPATYLFERFVDSPAIRFASYCAAIYEGRKDLRIKQRVVLIKSYFAEKAASMRSNEVPEIESDQ